MAKKSTSNGASPRIASQDKKAKTQKPSMKTTKPKAVEEPVPDNEDEWEDESDEEMVDAPVKKAKKAKKAALQTEDSDDDESSDDSEGGGFDFAALDESDSDSELGDDDDNEEEDGGDEEEIDVDDLDPGNSSEEEEIAATTRVRQTINNKDALLASLKRIKLDTTSSVPFAFHQSVVSSKATADAIPSVDDDLERELAFMNQALEAAREARKLLRKEGVPFTRPTDYFAETVRSDETMEKVKEKMIAEATAKKASAEARKQRDLKKFGKQVQVAKQQERAKQKRETLDKITLLKKKRKDGASASLGANEADDLFDVAVENELKGASGNKKRSFSAGDHGGAPNPKRQRKDAKYGFGGKKKYSKSGDATSAGDLSGFSAKRMKTGGGAGGGGGPKKFKPVARPGKARRKAAAGKR